MPRTDTIPFSPPPGERAERAASPPLSEGGCPMSSRMRDVLAREIDELRWEPTEKRVRATMGGRAAVDSTRALLVWEPQRVVPSYAVPLDDVRGELVRAPGVAPEGDPASLGFRWSEPGLPERVVLDPRVPFGVHTADGEPLGVRVGEASREGVAFRPADPDLGGHVILDFYGFDAWYEEEEPIVGHPRDPFHRIDILRSSRHVRIERDGHLLAESVRPRLLFETLLPTRFYLPREDVRAELRPSSKRTYCAYKGEASYWSPSVGGRTLDDLAWSYESPDARPRRWPASWRSSTSGWTSSWTASGWRGPTRRGPEVRVDESFPPCDQAAL